MILNRLIFPEYNNMNFVLKHTENGEKYQLPNGGKYYIIISEAVEPFEKICVHESETEHFNFSAEIPEGEYIFEVGMTDGNAVRRVILPALDEKLRPLNQLIVLRRLTK